MSLLTEKMEILKILLDVNDKSILKQIRLLLNSCSSMDETNYLLKSKNNREHLLESIKEIDNGSVVKIDPNNLWK